MYCGKCGTENPDTAKFCKECGEPLVAPTKVKVDQGEYIPVVENAESVTNEEKNDYESDKGECAFSSEESPGVDKKEGLDETKDFGKVENGNWTETEENADDLKASPKKKNNLFILIPVIGILAVICVVFYLSNANMQNTSASSSTQDDTSTSRDFVDICVDAYNYHKAATCDDFFDHFTYDQNRVYYDPRVEWSGKWDDESREAYKNSVLSDASISRGEAQQYYTECVYENNGIYTQYYKTLSDVLGNCGTIQSVGRIVVGTDGSSNGDIVQITELMFSSGRAYHLLQYDAEGNVRAEYYGFY